MKVTAIIVAYQSDLETLQKILHSLSGQCQTIVADNSPSERAGQLICDRGTGYISMHGNHGIGAAQNRAIQIAWSQGADAVMLLDDDSIPPPDMVCQLVACAEMMGSNAVVGANAINDEGFEIGNARNLPGAIPACREMMSSGALIRRDIFERVGPFDETLFIDGVDFDWGWRARKAGISLFVCRETAIIHRLGEGRIAGAGLPSPARHYYQYRNIIRLMTRTYTPWQWRLSQAVKLPTKLLLIAIFMPEKMKRLAFALSGIRDAVRGRNGPLPETPPSFSS